MTSIKLIVYDFDGVRIDNVFDVKKEVLARQKAKNTKKAKVNWQFNTKDARIKLKRLYPTLDI